MEICHLFISTGHNFVGHHGLEPDTHLMIETSEMKCVAGRGICGDRYFDFKDDYKGQITFFSLEVFDELCSAMQIQPGSPSLARRNVITRGVDLNDLIGQEFELQGVRFFGTEECRPCYWMDGAFAPGAQEFLKGRGGLRARILTDGTLCSMSRHPEQSRGIPQNYFEVMPWDSSTPLRSARNDISAVLLAGGESRRMGTDKATFLFRGKPLWQIQLETLRRLRPAEIFVSARTDPSWRPNDVQFIADIPPSCGPLSGIAALLAKIRTTHLLALAIDMPFMTENYLGSIRDAIEPGRGVVAKIGNRAEPLAAVYPREAEIDFRAALAGSDFSLQNVVRHLVTSGKLLEISVTEQEKRLFRNVNNVSDVDAAIAGG